jgi:hypothetical protein
MVSSPSTRKRCRRIPRLLADRAHPAVRLFKSGPLPDSSHTLWFPIRLKPGQAGSRPRGSCPDRPGTFPGGLTPRWTRPPNERLTGGSAFQAIGPVRAFRLLSGTPNFPCPTGPAGVESGVRAVIAVFVLLTSEGCASTERIDPRSPGDRCLYSCIDGMRCVGTIFRKANGPLYGRCELEMHRCATSVDCVGGDICVRFGSDIGVCHPVTFP